MPSHKDYVRYIRNKKYIETTEAKYQEVINDVFNIGAEFIAEKVFEAVRNPKKEKPTTLYAVFELYIAILLNEDKFCNAANIKGTLNKLKGYSCRDMLFTEVNAGLLEAKEKEIER